MSAHVRTTFLTGALISALSLTACGSEGGDEDPTGTDASTPATEAPTVSALTVSPETADPNSEVSVSYTTSGATSVKLTVGDKTLLDTDAASGTTTFTMPLTEAAVKLVATNEAGSTEQSAAVKSSVVTVACTTYSDPFEAAAFNASPSTCDGFHTPRASTAWSVDSKAGDMIVLQRPTNAGTCEYTDDASIEVFSGPGWPGFVEFKGCAATGGTDLYAPSWRNMTAGSTVFLLDYKKEMPEGSLTYLSVKSVAPSCGDGVVDYKTETCEPPGQYMCDAQCQTTEDAVEISAAQSSALTILSGVELHAGESLAVPIHNSSAAARQLASVTFDFDGYSSTNDNHLLWLRIIDADGQILYAGDENRRYPTKSPAAGLADLEIPAGETVYLIVWPPAPEYEVEVKNLSIQATAVN